MNKTICILFSLVIFHITSFAQEIVVHGMINDENGNPISEVNVLYNNQGVASNTSGEYALTINSNSNVIDLLFSHISYQSQSVKIDLISDSIRHNITMSLKSSQLSNIEVYGDENTLNEVNKIDPRKVAVIASAGEGLSAILKSLPGVSSNNELSSQYMVRGGSFDENLIYVNGMEVYRPQLIRSGQQEGLSFVNTSMIENINFFAGGFESSYGDKMSSVLDISYRKPEEFNTSIEASLLGASITNDLVSKDGRLSSIIGFRYKNIALINSTKDTEANFNPNYTDLQSVVNYKYSEKVNISILANLSLNNYKYEPISRRTNFGTLNQPLQLNVYYDGYEIDKYFTWMLGSNVEIKHSDKFLSEFTISAFQSQESEFYDLLGQYQLSELNNELGSDDYGNPLYTVGIGTQLEHARNELDVFVINAGFNNSHILDNSTIKYGLKYSRESIYDRLNEWTYIDSAGYSLPHISKEPYQIYEDQIEVYQGASSYNELNSNRIQTFAQYESTFGIDNFKFNYNIGIRANYWDVNNQFSVSPRFIIDFKNIDNPNILYWLSIGKYSQTPFYRELRMLDGELNKDVKAQDSWHFLIGSNYDFKIWERPFRLTSELYYKKINNLNPYNIENVRLRYYAHNDAEAYIAGADFRINGEFVPGVESWMSMGVMNAKQNINDRGSIPMPTDQRFKFAIFFQDYLPKFPSFKVNINLVYNTGLPGGGPNYSDPYKYQLRLPDYKRLDIGFTKVLSDRKNNISTKWFPDVKYASVSLEVLNIADIANTISYSWVRDIYTKGMYAVPNKLTGRFWNLKFNVNI